MIFSHYFWANNLTFMNRSLYRMLHRSFYRILYHGTCCWNVQKPVRYHLHGDSLSSSKASPVNLKFMNDLSYQVANYYIKITVCLAYCSCIYSSMGVTSTCGKRQESTVVSYLSSPLQKNSNTEMFS